LAKQWVLQNPAIQGVKAVVLHGKITLVFFPQISGLFMSISIILLQRDHEASPHLQALLDAQRGFYVVGVAHTVEHARVLLTQTQPHLLVTDLAVQDGQTTSLIQTLHQYTKSRPSVLVTTLSHDDALLLRALRDGADGYWVHTSAPELLVNTAQQLTQGESAMSPTIARQVLHFFEELDPALALAPSAGLTRRENEILRWLAKGYLVEEVAEQWQTSLHSVASSIRHVVRKMQSQTQPRGWCSI
jgi:DNA-binding NarL/FixJ family response regulator